MKIVVTGASGFIGKHLINKLLSMNVETCGVSRQPINFYNAVNVKSYYDTPAGDILIHLAENSNRTKENETNQSTTIIKHLSSKGFKRIIYVSSVAVYGDKSLKPHKPGEKVFPYDNYSKYKIACEKLISEKEGVVARMSNIYGPGMSKNNVFSNIIRQISPNKNMKIWSDKPIRDFLWVEDAVDALVKMALGSEIGIFNVASGRAVSIKELIHIIVNTYGLKGNYSVELTKKIDKQSTIAVDISKTCEIFEWMPKKKLEEGIKELLKRTG